MKSKLLPFLLLASTTGLASNTVNFTGIVAAKTCDVAVNGSASPTILLPTVQVTSLTYAYNAVSGQTPFNIAATNCPQVDRDVELKVTFIGNNVTSDGWALGNTGTARNVDLQISTSSHGAAINLGTPWNVSGFGIKILANSTTGNRDYYARYYSYRGNATPGSVRGSMQYMVAYP